MAGISTIPKWLDDSYSLGYHLTIYYHKYLVVIGESRIVIGDETFPSFHHIQSTFQSPFPPFYPPFYLFYP